MNRLFRERAMTGIHIDDDGTAAKHDSVALRESRGSWRAGERRRFITARRLADWLLSDWRHKRRHMGLAELSFEPVRCGLYYSLRLGGVWVAADWWLQYFAVDGQVTALRLEHLADDLNSHLLPLLPAGTAPFRQLPRANPGSAEEPLNPAPGKTAFSGPALNSPTWNSPTFNSPVFSAADLERIASVNPRWSAWEEQVYGP